MGPPEQPDRRPAHRLDPAHVVARGGHLAEPYEQDTQQSPGFGRSNRLHPLH